MDNYMISVMIFLAFVFIARIINERANKTLTSEKKAELIDLFSQSRITTFGFIIVIIGFYFLALKYQVFDPIISLVVYIVLLLIFITYNTKFSYDKLKSNEFPDSFIKSYLLATTIRFLGVLIFVGLLLADIT